MTSSPNEARTNRGALLAVAALVAFGVVAFAPARPTNFRGFDEWVNISLLSRGVLEFPYTNRPLNNVWGLPAWRLFPDRLSGFLVVHVAWLVLGGVLTFLITRRLLPRATALAFLAGALAMVWAPGDRSRLCSVQMILHSGCTFGSLLASWLTLEAWSRRRLAPALGAVLAGALAVLSFEATLAPLGLVPLLLLVAGGAREPQRLALWTAAILGLLLAGGLRFVMPYWSDPERVSYQLGGTPPDFTPGPLLDRTRRQLRRHIAPVAERPPTEGSWPVVPVALAVFAAGLVVSRRIRPCPEGQGGAEPSRAALALAGGLGLVWAVASYLPFVINPETHGAERMEFLSTPGVAVFLAATVFGLASWLPPRARLPAAALLGGWIVAAGVARTAALQAEWDRRSAFPDQRRALLELTAVVPDVAPGTLVVLLGGGAWPLDMSFRHAVLYFYEGRAVGHAVNGLEYMYETRFESAGVRSIPRPVIQGPWRESPALYGYDAVVAIRADASDRVQLLETWPEELGPLPPGATYAPRARIRFGPRLPRLRILGK